MSKAWWRFKCGLVVGLQISFAVYLLTATLFRMADPRLALFCGGAYLVYCLVGKNDKVEEKFDRKDGYNVNKKTK